MVEIFKNYSLKSYNTFGIEASAENFTSFSNVNDLKEILKAAGDNKKLVIGGGSNILLTHDVQGYVLKNNIHTISLLGEDDEHYYVEAGAGENWHQFVLFCIKNNFAGVENLSLIPGCVGASPMQNIGAYGVEIKDYFHELQALHIHEQVVETFSAADCKFGYRESIFKNALKDQFVILNVTFRLLKKPQLRTDYGAIRQELEKDKIEDPTIRDVSNAVIKIRSSKLPDPNLIGNAGSFFKNPVVPQALSKSLQQMHPEMPSFLLPDTNFSKIPAGWLIEKAGWKGFRKQDAGVHNKQALVLVNYGNAQGKEIYDLSEEIIQDIYTKFGITLEREVNII